MLSSMSVPATQWSYGVSAWRELASTATWRGEVMVGVASRGLRGSGHGKVEVDAVPYPEVLDQPLDAAEVPDQPSDTIGPAVGQHLPAAPDGGPLDDHLPSAQILGGESAERSRQGQCEAIPLLEVEVGPQRFGDLDHDCSMSAFVPGVHGGDGPVEGLNGLVSRKEREQGVDADLGDDRPYERQEVRFPRFRR